MNNLGFVLVSFRSIMILMKIKCFADLLRIVFNYWRERGRSCSAAPTEKELVKTVNGVVELCGCGDFKLVKIASNSTEVLKAVPEELKAKGLKDPEDEHGELKLLGLVYDDKEDNLYVRSDKKLGGGPEIEFHTSRNGYF